MDFRVVETRYPGPSSASLSLWVPPDSLATSLDWARKGPLPPAFPHRLEMSLGQREPGWADARVRLSPGALGRVGGGRRRAWAAPRGAWQGFVPSLASAVLNACSSSSPPGVCDSPQIRPHKLSNACSSLPQSKDVESFLGLNLAATKSFRGFPPVNCNTG